MMKNYSKHIFYTCVLFLFGVLHLATAQDSTPATLKMSEAFNVPRNTSINRIISTDSEYAYLLRNSYAVSTKLTSVIVETYDIKSLKLKNARNIDLKYQKKLRVFHDIFEVNDKFYLITSYFNSAKDKNFLFAQKLDKKFAPSDDLVLIGEIDSRNEVQIGDFEIQHSRDSTKVIIYHDIPTKQSEAQQAKVSIYNDDFELLWDKRITMPFENKLYNRIKFDVDNKGNAYLLGKHYFVKVKNTVKNKPNFEFILTAFSEQGAQVDKYQLSDKQKFISDLTFEVNSRNEIICSGFYTNKIQNGGFNAGNYTESIEGIVFFKVDNAEKRMEEKKFTKFDLDFITLNKPERIKRKAQRRQSDGNVGNNPALYSYDFRDVILRSDGGAVIIAEQYYETQQNNSNGFSSGFNNGSRGFNNNTFRQVTETNYNDIIVVNIRPDGSIQWANAVPKYQVSTNPDTEKFLSFANANIGNKIYLLFNEDKSVFGIGNAGRRSSNALALAELNKKGELSIHLLADSEDLRRSIIVPTLTKQIAKKELLIYGKGKNSFRLGRVTLD